MDKPTNNCNKCKCKEYRENEILSLLHEHGLGMAFTISVGILMGALTYGMMLSK